MPPTATPTLVARPLAPCTQYNYCYVASAYGELAVVPTSQLAWLVDHGTAGEKASSGDNLLQQQQHALCSTTHSCYARCCLMMMLRADWGPGHAVECM